MDNVEDRTTWAVHYVDGPSRQFITRGGSATIEQARTEACQAIADEQNRMIKSDRDSLAEIRANTPQSSLEAAIRSVPGGFLADWLDHLIDEWGFRKERSPEGGRNPG